MTYRIELEPTRYVLRVFNEDNPVNYIGTAQLDINGKSAQMHSLMGPDFYKALAEQGLAPFRSLGLSKVNVVMTEAHFRMLQRQLREKAKITVRETYPYKGRTFVDADITELTSEETHGISTQF